MDFIKKIKFQKKFLKDWHVIFQISVFFSEIKKEKNNKNKKNLKFLPKKK